MDYHLNKTKAKVLRDELKKKTIGHRELDEKIAQTVGLLEDEIQQRIMNVRELIGVNEDARAGRENLIRGEFKASLSETE